MFACFIGSNVGSFLNRSSRDITATVSSKVALGKKNSPRRQRSSILANTFLSNTTTFHFFLRLAERAVKHCRSSRDPDGIDKKTSKPRTITFQMLECNLAMLGQLRAGYMASRHMKVLRMSHCFTRLTSPLHLPSVMVVACIFVVLCFSVLCKCFEGVLFISSRVLDDRQCFIAAKKKEENLVRQRSRRSEQSKVANPSGKQTKQRNTRSTSRFFFCSMLLG